LNERVLKIGLLGCGNVGASVVRLLADHGDDIAARAGCRLEVAKVAVRDTSRDRGTGLDPSLITDDASAVISDPEVDIVCEVMGGVEPTKRLILEALERGKPVVTANKELLANEGR
jgi:homoserine dehydrogenase